LAAYREKGDVTMPQVVIGLIVAMALAVVNAIIAQATQKKPKAAAAEPTGHLIDKCDSQAPIPLLYGRTRVGINKAYIGTSGADNKYLHIIGLLGEGTINGIAQTGSVDQVFLDDLLYTSFGSLVHYEIFTGTPNQSVCATLHAALTGWNDPLRHTAYIYVRLQYDQDKFQKIPTITVEIEGLKIYNPGSNEYLRDENGNLVTGEDGEYIYDTSALPTWEYSNNPALCALDYITRPSSRGGVGIGYDRLVETNLTGTTAYCTEKGWTCNLPIIDNQACVDNLTEILTTFRGAVMYAVTQFKLLYADLDYETSCLSIDEDDIVQHGKYSTLVPKQPSIFNCANAIRIKYLNKANKYILDDYVLADSDAIAQAGSYREETVQIRGIDNAPNAMKMANYYLEKEQVNKTISAQLHARCCALEAHDVFDVTHDDRGWDAKYFRVKAIAVDGNMNVTIEAEEEEEEFYNDTYDMATHDWYDTMLPRPSDAVRQVINVSHTEEVYYYRERSFTRWKISFDKPAEEDYPWWDYAEIWIKIGSGDYVYMTKSRSDYTLDPVQEGETYSCKIVSVSIFGAKEAFSTAYTVSRYMTGKTDVPSNLTGVTGVASGDSLTLWADPVIDPDIEGYEIRIGSSWSGGLLFAFTKAPYIRLTGVKTGEFTFFIAAKDNGGHYSETPVSCTVTILGPAGYTDKNTWSWDFSTGDHSNTEQTTHGGNNVLGGTHTGGVLVGTWTSPEYDLGSKKKVRIYGDFITDFASSALTWGSVFPAGALWSDIAAGTSWARLLAQDDAGQLQATIFWGDTSGVLTNSADFFQILAVEIDARYVQVEVTITDPQDDAHVYLRTLNMKAQYWA
jgi:hypothetical protein